MNTRIAVRPFNVPTNSDIETFGGTIVSTFAENFQFVQARQPIVRLLDKARIEFVVNIPETMISLINYVESVEVEFDAFRGVRIPAEISEVGTEASAGTRTFPVTLTINQPTGIIILPGMAGTATGDPSDIPGEAAEDEFLLPVGAFFTPDSKTHKVWVIDEATMTVKGHEVTRGRLTARGQYARGLKEGMIVATAGAHIRMLQAMIDRVAD